MSFGRSRQIVPGDCSLLLCALEAIDTSKWRETITKANFSFVPFASVLGTTLIHAHRNIQQIRDRFSVAAFVPNNLTARRLGIDT